MKKLISVLLIMILLASCLTITVSAEPADKIDPVVRAQIDANTEGGMVVRIRYHNDNYPTEGLSDEEFVNNTLAAQRELRQSIEAITYCEPGNLIHYDGTMDIGLPYSSIEAVAALPNVDYIDLPAEGCNAPAEDKLSDASKEKLAALSADDKVNLDVWLAYNINAYIGMAEPGDDCTHAEVDEYLQIMRTAKKNYAAARNEEYIERITAAVEVETIKALKMTPIVYIRTTADKVMEIAALPEVWTVDISDETETVVEPIEETSATIDAKFEQWMLKTKYAVKGNDDDPIHYGEQMEYRHYRELYTGDGWTLIYAELEGMVEPWEFVGSIVLGDRVLSWRAPGVEEFGYYVYSAALDTFLEINDMMREDYDGVLDRDGILAALDELKIGRPLGDADGDGELTIVDATAIQRDQAELAALPQEDIYTCFKSVCWRDFRYADADCDGDVTVLDATRNQRRLADLEE